MIQNFTLRDLTIRDIASKLGMALIYLVVIVVMVFPIYWLVLTSLKPANLAQTNPPVFFTPLLSIENYRALWGDSDIRGFFANSLVVALGATGFSLCFGALAAYALSKSYLRFGLRRAILLWVLLIRIFPPIVVGIPYFTLLHRFYLTDTRLGLMITHVAMTLPFVIWLLLGFFQDVPAELEKAAMLDGCSLLRRFGQISLPLVLPGLAVTAIFAFILSWNEYLFAAILTSFNAKTLPVAIATFIGERRLEWGAMSALGSLMLIPPAIFAFLGQQYIVRGLTFGAVKE
jgi:multiple sugar transport system permease protein